VVTVLYSYVKRLQIASKPALCHLHTHASVIKQYSLVPVTSFDRLMQYSWYFVISWLVNRHTVQHVLSTGRGKPFTHIFPHHQSVQLGANISWAVNKHSVRHTGPLCSWSCSFGRCLAEGHRLGDQRSGVVRCCSGR